MVRFEIPECRSEDVERLRGKLGVSAAIAQVLVRRGLRDPGRARAFLAADERHELSSFPGLSATAQAILEHVRRRSRITIHGDYDVDGVCATAVLVRALRGLGAEVDWHLPDRMEGYGLSMQTVSRLAQRGTQLLITVDCAITAVEEVAHASALGIDVVASDHHAPRSDGMLPDALIVHPALCGYPCPELCAAAVAHKLAQAIVEAAGRDPNELAPDLDLVALATVADVVPLLGENRALVRSGLRALSSTAKPGLRALMAVARVEPTSVDERAIGFALAPRINAAGRLYRADAALELILTESGERAAEIAQELDRANSERRHAERVIRAQAETQLAQLGDPSARFAHVLAGENWHPGVIGIVAARLVERHRRPVVLVSLDGDRGRGSGRSIEGFDLLAGLTACSEHLLRYGGHSAAAGVELERDAVQAFAAALDGYAGRTLAPEDFARVERVDAVVGGAELGMELAEELRLLAPFGRANPTVSLMVRDAVLADMRPMGDGKHARFTVHSEGAHARAVAFGVDGSLGALQDEPVSATFTLEVNEWNGVSEPRLVLRHAQPAREGATLNPCLRVGDQSTLFPLPAPITASAAPS